MRKLALATALAALALTTACGGDDAGTTATPPADDQATTDATPSEPATASSSEPAEGGGQTLVATVGSESDPEAFVITLTDESGSPVTTLPAGDYTIEVTDHATLHNFHLTGPGGVEETTTVPEVTETSWDVTLEEGDYSYVCDPHPRMVGGFEVTAA